MTSKEASEVLKASSIQQMSFCKVVVNGKAFNVKEALGMAIKSLEAWEKVREDLRKFIDANKNSGDMYLEGRADGGWHALAAIRRCLGEIEDEIQAGDGGCQGPDQRDTGSVQG